VYRFLREVEVGQPLLWRVVIRGSEILVESDLGFSEVTLVNVVERLEEEWKVLVLFSVGVGGASGAITWAAPPVGRAGRRSAMR
jgi:hypothetical protein